MRYDFDSLTDRADTLSSKWRIVGDELPMWVADMDFKAAPEILSAVQKRLNNGVFGYSFIPKEWNEAICSWWQRRHSVKFEPSWLMFCTGVVPAISSAIRRFTSVNDKILVQAPVYHLFFSCITNNGRQAVSNDLVYQNGEYHIDFDDLEKKLSDPLTTMMLLCNPQNPAGKIWDEATLAKIGELCHKYHVLVLSDEIHCDLTDPDAKYVPFMRVNETCKQNSITCISPTKAFNLAGLQTSAIVVPNENLRAKMSMAIAIDGINEANSFAIVATISAFNECEMWLDELNLYIYENKKIVQNFINQNNLPISLVATNATYLLWLDCSKICDDSTTLVKFLRDKTGLWLNDGNIYKGGKFFARMNIATQKSRLIDGLNRLKNGVELFLSEKK